MKRLCLPWEYWPTWLATPPVIAIYLWFALRARHLVFFSNVNPGIPMGGIVGESKKAILDQIPPEYLPKTVFIPARTPKAQVLSAVQASELSFPLIAKPDMGERGFLVHKIKDSDELIAYLDRHPVDFLIQEFLEEPVEAAVLFYRFPDGRFGITSVCLKDFLHVTGDGCSSVEALMARDPRAQRQLVRFQQTAPELLRRIPASGEQVLLEPIGNHARGTKFLNAKFLITPDLLDSFHALCTRLDGIRYGRFDLKTHSAEALQRGEFKIMELNGITSDPAHVYDPAFGALRAYREYYRHWRIIYHLHRAQRKAGIPPASHRAAWRFFRDYFRR
jgi:hypothetical protein